MNMNMYYIHVLTRYIILVIAGEQNLYTLFFGGDEGEGVYPGVANFVKKIK